MSTPLSVPWRTAAPSECPGAVYAGGELVAVATDDDLAERIAALQTADLIRRRVDLEEDLERMRRAERSLWRRLRRRPDAGLADAEWCLKCGET